MQLLLRTPMITFAALQLYHSLSVTFLSYPDEKRAETGAHVIFTTALMLPGHTKMNLFSADHREPTPPYKHKFSIQFLFTKDKRKLIKQKRSLKNESSYMLSIKQK